VSREVAYWDARALTIDDADARARVRDDLRVKRSYLNGSAYFNSLLPHWSKELVRLLVAFQVLANYLDAVSERDAARRHAIPRSWAAMLCDAVDLDREPAAKLYDDVGPEEIR
jgi:hypothetical protein